MCKFWGTVSGFKHRVLGVVGLVFVSMLIAGATKTTGQSMITGRSISIVSPDGTTLLNRFGREEQQTVGAGTVNLPFLPSLQSRWAGFEGAWQPNSTPWFLSVRASTGGRKLSEVVRRKATFIRFTLPLIQRANEFILRDRDRILDLSRRTERGWALSPADTAWLFSITERYGMKKTDIRELLVRVDIIPPSLAIAQAAEESGWGTSRFATEGNALFGQRIYKQGNKGMVPHKRAKGKSFKVRAFAQLIDGVKAYVHNLNSHFAYKKFREQRAELRTKKKAINGYLLAGTLTRYSERGSDYVNSIRSIMRANALGFLDTGRLWRPELLDLKGPDA